MDLNLTDDQRAIQDLAGKFAKRHFVPIEAEYWVKQKHPAHLFEKMNESGFLGANVPEEFGGMGLDTVSLMLITKEFAKVSPSFCLSLHIVQNSLVAPPLAKYGTPEQIEKYLKPTMKGKRFGCFGLTEPGYGSDAAGVTTKAVLKAANGTPPISYYCLNGEKTFITNVTFADFILVLARTRLPRDPEKKHDGLTAFVVDIDETCERKEIKKIGLHPSPFGKIHFYDTSVLPENMLGKEGEGFKVFMDTLTSGRLFIAAQAWGVAEAAYEDALGYAKERMTFDKPLIEHQVIKHTLVDMKRKVDGMARQIIAAARLKDSGEDYKNLASDAKIQSTEDAVWICDRAIQIYGGAGYTTDVRVGRLWVDARAFTIYEGATEIQKEIIARSL